MKKKGGCKLVGLVTVLAMAFGIMAMAEEPAINPATVLTPRAVLYGTAPLKIGSTEFTEAQLSAAKAGTVALANTKVFIGSAGGVAAAQTISGDATLAANGAVTLATVTVAKGGTGATTLTGLVKGNGTSAMTAASAGTDYLAPATGASVTNATLVLTGDGVTNTLTIVKGVITAIVTTP
jgi:hypothetical protein